MRRQEEKRKGTFLIWGLCPQTPAIYRFRARMTGGTMGALERRIGRRSDATRAPTPGPECQGAASAALNINPRPRPTLTYCGRKMV